MKYRITTLGMLHDIEADSAEQAVIALMETKYADYGAKWSAVPDKNAPDHFDIKQRGRYVTYAQVRPNKDNEPENQDDRAKWEAEQ